MKTIDNYLSILNEQDTPLSKLKKDIGELLKRKKDLEAEQIQLKQKLASPKYKKYPSLSFTTGSEQRVGKKQLDGVQRELTAKLKELDKLKGVVIKAFRPKSAISPTPVKDIITKPKEPVKDIITKTKAPVKDIVTKVKEPVKDIILKPKEREQVKDIITKTKEKLTKDPLQLPNLGKYILAGVAVAAAIALIYYSSNQLYKRYLSKHARSCSKLKGKSKAVCILNSQLRALSLQKRSLQKLTPGCSKSEDPRKCKGKLSHKILKLTRRISKSSMRLKELK